MLDVSTETTIRAAVDRVAEFAADPGNAPLWYANIASVEWVTAPPLRVGSRLNFVAHFLGRRLTYTYQVAAFVPMHRLVMETAEGPFTMQTTYEWLSEGAGVTRMTLRNRGMPRGFARVLVPFLAFAVRVANRKDLARLKSLLETEHIEGK